jgi:hypothetical protein
MASFSTLTLSKCFEEITPSQFATILTLSRRTHACCR